MTVRDLGLALVGAAPWLGRVGRWVYRKLPEFLHGTPTSRLREYFSERSSVTFVQIGAFDGVAGDPIRPLMLANYCWTGVMVEPQSDAFERLKRNYAAQSQRQKFLNAAISDEPGERTLFYISEAEIEALGLPDWAPEIPSFDPEHLSKHFPQAKLARHNVRTTTFEEAASLLPAGGIDVVVIDTEGHERTIVDTIDLDLHHVKFVMFEHKHRERPPCGRGQAARERVLAQEVRPRHRSVARSGASWWRDQVRARICLHWHSTAFGQPAAQRCGR